MYSYEQNKDDIMHALKIIIAKFFIPLANSIFFPGYIVPLLATLITLFLLVINHVLPLILLVPKGDSVPDLEKVVCS